MKHLDDLRLLDPALEPIAEKVVAGERLDREDGVRVATTDDLLGVGRLANIVRERLHGDRTYYNINRHLNPTNVCVASCKLCAFYVPWRDRDRGWTYTVEQAVEVAARDVDESVSELHIVGGLHPELRVEYYEQLFAALKERFPWIHLKALTMTEFDFISTASRISVDETISRLKTAGLDSCPGGGAEIFAERARRQICDHKTDGARWLAISRQVHRAGLKSNCTMLYGHVETAEERVDHLLDLRALQDETGGFQCMIPLAFHPENTALDHLPPTGGRLDIQTIATTRLVLDNVPHLKAYWIMLGEKVAQIALSFGANDLDGTVVDERITYAAGGTAGTGLSRQRLENLIREAGRTPVLRDTLYRPLDGSGSGLSSRESDGVAAS
ncbi:MAG: aminofutalosine synthase MqnE [Thermoanaerobaculales bacterium]|jgi:aminodeoxyfutalosine synthase|nr:aminofutalosine synthase MqnE [Thermoanaerobaculales bacterium]